MTTFNLKGRNAIVTGSARGMGAQFALDLAKAGANVLLVSMQYMSGC
jgi:3-oxoacyl-[acyl-carrier protein] reductase